MTEDTRAVLVDTDVYSHFYIPKKHPTGAVSQHIQHIQDALRGRRVVISFQTRAEILSGALQARWREDRMRALRAQLDATATISVDVDVIDAYADLTAQCRQQGHGLQDKVHTGDRWIAACAVAKEVPLLSLDRIFDGAPLVEHLRGGEWASPTTGA